MKTLKQLFLFFISFIAILFLSELFIRVSKIANPSPNEFYNDIGRGRRKDLSYLFFNEGFGIGRFNKYRYIGESCSPNKETNTIRVALLGDSYIEAFQVFERDYFGVIAKKLLESKYPSTKFEFLNFGRSGFDIADMYAYNELFVKNFNPDFIIFFVSNEDLEPKEVDPLLPKVIAEGDSLLISLDFNQQSIDFYRKTNFLTQRFCISQMTINGIKKAQEGSIWAVFFDKFYHWLKPNLTDTSSSSRSISSEYLVHPLTQKIIEQLEANKTIIVNRDSRDLPAAFVKLCLVRGLQYYPLNKKLDSLKRLGIDPNYWHVTNKYGHWNHNAHSFIANEMFAIINKSIENRALLNKNAFLQ